MKKTTLKKKIGLAIAIAALSGIPMMGLANPGGTYKGKARQNKIVGDAVPKAWPQTKITLKLPNGKGKLSGRLFTSKLPGFTGFPPPFGNQFVKDISIAGKVRKATSRQGGKKIVLSGRWTWKFKLAATNVPPPPPVIPIGPPSDVRGPFRFAIVKARNTYKIKGNVLVQNNTVPAYKYRSTVSAKK